MWVGLEGPESRGPARSETGDPEPRSLSLQIDPFFGLPACLWIGASCPGRRRRRAAANGPVHDTPIQKHSNQPKRRPPPPLPPLPSDPHALPSRTHPLLQRATTRTREANKTSFPSALLFFRAPEPSSRSSESELPKSLHIATHDVEKVAVVGSAPAGIVNDDPQAEGLEPSARRC